MKDRDRKIISYSCCETTLYIFEISQCRLESCPLNPGSHFKQKIHHLQKVKVERNFGGNPCICMASKCEFELTLPYLLWNELILSTVTSHNFTDTFTHSEITCLTETSVDFRKSCRRDMRASLYATTRALADFRKQTRCRRDMRASLCDAGSQTFKGANLLQLKKIREDPNRRELT